MARRSVKGIGIQPLMPAYDAPFTDRTRQGAQNYFQNMDLDKEEKTKQEDNSGVRHARHLTIQGETPDPEQKKNMELIITTAQEVDGSNDLSVMSCIVAVIQESAAKNLKGGDGSSSGVLQVTQSTGVSHGVDPRDIDAVVKEFMKKGFFSYGGAISLARKHPNFSPGDIAWRVQGPLASLNGRYAKWEDEAEKWLGAASGGRIQGGSKEYRRQYQYKREKDENSWDAMQRLAGDVKWRCFPVGRVLYYMSEIDLFKRRVAYHLTPDDPSLIEFTYDVDWRAKVPANEGTITVNLTRFGAPPGYPIELSGFGPPDGRWLIISVRRDWFSPIAEVTIRQPLTPAAEPDDAGKGERAGTGAETDGSGMNLYKECRRISNAGGTYVYGGGHGVPLSSLNSGQGLDCSSSVSLALYRAKLWDHRAIARVSGDFSDWGRKGRGNIFTVCYNSGHVYIRFESALSVDAQRFDTSTWGGDKNSERGPRLRSSQGPPGDSGYGLRHWPEM
jgi:hypothetical protein